MLRISQNMVISLINISEICETLAKNRKILTKREILKPSCVQLMKCDAITGCHRRADHIGGGAPGAPEGPRGDRPPEGGPGGALPLPRVSQKTENRSDGSQIELARFALIPSPLLLLKCSQLYK